MATISRITFYVNPSWRRKGIHTPLLNPWWGNPLTESSLYTKQLFDSYSFDTSYYTATADINFADAVLAPYPQAWFLRHDKALFDECIMTARKHSLPLLVDGSGDVEYTISGNNIFVLRYGGYRFLPEKGRIQIPLYADDLLARYRNGELSVRKKVSKPSIGFAGWGALSMQQRLRTYAKELPLRLRALVDPRYRACTKGVLWREKAIRMLEQSPLVTLNARVRGTFSGTAKTAEGDQRRLQKEMVNTFLGSDYALDVKGDANNSARLFEALSLGRIPVIVDTERNFPFADEVDYSSFALIVDFRDIKKLPERIAEFHKNISPERFEEMQKNARNAYVNYFRIDAVMRHVVPELKRQLAAAHGRF